MNKQFWLDQLDLVGQQLDEVSALLLEGDPSHLECSAARLQQLSTNLKELVDGAGRQQVQTVLFVKRLSQMVSRFATLREGLLRRMAHVERALQIVVPTTTRATYVTNGVYGNARRQSGAFKVLSA
jgi:hypothetical protein